MKHADPRYSRFHLVREMLQTPEVIRRFDPGAVEPFADAVRRAGRTGRLFLTGEGSSRIFPARSRSPAWSRSSAAPGRWSISASWSSASTRRAVVLAAEGVSGVMVSIVRDSSDPYCWSLGTAPLSEVALGAKPMPDAFINAEGNDVTEACLEYLRPLVGPLPEYARLAGGR